MTKNEFITLFELEKIYNKYQFKNSFGFGLLDNQTGTKNAIFYIFDEKNVKIVIECDELNKEQNPQRLEVHLILHEKNIEMNKNEVFINEVFPFLTFDTNLEASLKFIANFNNKILIPKYNLMGTVSSF